MQSSLDPRDGFLKAVEGEKAVQAPKVWKATANQRPWIENMIRDKFLQEQADERIAKLNWTDPEGEDYVDRPRFERIKKFLINTPNLKKMGLPAPAPQMLDFPSDMMHGTYTITFMDGTYRVLKIEKQGLDEEFKPGTVLLSYQSGPNNDHDYRGFGEVTPEGKIKIWFKHRNNAEVLRALRVLVDQPNEGDAGLEIIHSGKCAACNRTLTAPESENPYRTMGYGPTCGAELFG